MNTGIILVLYKQGSHLERLYLSLAKQSYKDFCIYFVDNNAGPEDKDISERLNTKYNLRIKYLKPGYNSGFAGGNNIGAAEAISDGCETVFFLNNDMELEPKCIEELNKLLLSSDNVGAAAPLILFGNNEEAEKIQEYGAMADFNKYRIRKNYEGSLYNEIENKIPEILKVNLVSGGAVLAKSGALKKTGCWEEDYFAYGDEIDFARRVNEAGYKMYVTKKAVARHYHQWNKNNKQSFYFEYYLIQRNKFLYFKKFKLYRQLLTALLTDVIKFPVRLIWFIKVCDFKLGIYYLRGIFAGLIGKKGNPNLFK